MIYTILSVLVAVALILTFLVWKGVKSRLMKKNDRMFIRELWADLLSQENPMLRVVEADKILDAALTRMGYKGTLGEKLTQAGARFTDLNGVWFAHKLRNTLVHEVNAPCSSKDVENALKNFEKALLDLGAL